MAAEPPEAKPEAKGEGKPEGKAKGEGKPKGEKGEGKPKGEGQAQGRGQTPGPRRNNACQTATQRDEPGLPARNRQWRVSDETRATPIRGQRAGRFRREDSPERLRGQGRPAVQLQRTRRRRRSPRPGLLRLRQGQRGAARPSKRRSRRARATSSGPKKISLRGNTIPHRVIGKYGASRVILVPAGPGTGVKAGPGVREVLQACGITNILTKVHGSTNPLNLVKATIHGLLQLRTKEEVVRLRGVAI